MLTVSNTTCHVYWPAVTTSLQEPSSIRSASDFDEKPANWRKL